MAGNALCPWQMVAFEHSIARISSFSYCELYETGTGSRKRGGEVEGAKAITYRCPLGRRFSAEKTGNRPQLELVPGRIGFKLGTRFNLWDDYASTDGFDRL